MSHVEVAPMAMDARPAIVLDNVNRADFYAITAPSQKPAFALKTVTDVRILMSRAAKDTVIAKADDIAV